MNSEYKMSFEVRSSTAAGKEQGRLESFTSVMHEIGSSAVLHLILEPSSDYACPPPLTWISETVIDLHPDADEQTLMGLFMEKLSFNEGQLKELEKATRAQAGSCELRQQRLGCITGTKICDTFTKMNTIMQARSKKLKRHHC